MLTEIWEIMQLSSCSMVDTKYCIIYIWIKLDLLFYFLIYLFFFLLLLMFSLIWNDVLSSCSFGIIVF